MLFSLLMMIAAFLLVWFIKAFEPAEAMRSIALAAYTDAPQSNDTVGVTQVLTERNTNA